LLSSSWLSSAVLARLTVRSEGGIDLEYRKDAFGGNGKWEMGNGRLRGPSMSVGCYGTVRYGCGTVAIRVSLRNSSVGLVIPGERTRVDTTMSKITTSDIRNRVQSVGVGICADGRC